MFGFLLWLLQVAWIIQITRAITSNLIGWEADWIEMPQEPLTKDEIIARLAEKTNDLIRENRAYRAKIFGYDPNEHAHGDAFTWAFQEKFVVHSHGPVVQHPDRRAGNKVESSGRHYHEAGQPTGDWRGDGRVPKILWHRDGDEVSYTRVDQLMPLDWQPEGDGNVPSSKRSS
jgi:hypothetical protein